MPVPEQRTLSEAVFLRREPRQARSAERLDLLVDATAQLLLSEGYPGVTARALSERTGMPHSTIYDVVSEPRDLVAVAAVRTLDAMHHGLVAWASTVRTGDEAVAFVKAVVTAYIELYRSDAVLRAALSGLDGDPSYRWINLADSDRNARVIADVLVRFSDQDPVFIYERSLLMAHLTTATSAMAFDLGPERGDTIIARFHEILELLLETGRRSEAL